ncbi:MAG: hypothetical protein OXF02_07450 [Simkaniaceae bacterium]|nr:hypothetical protein [Simkaniaceae bacterium]
MDTPSENGKVNKEKDAGARARVREESLIRLYRSKMRELSFDFKDNLLAKGVTGPGGETKQTVNSPHVGLLRGMRGLNVETLQMLRIGLVQKVISLKGSDCGMPHLKEITIYPGYTIPIFDPEKGGEVVAIKMRMFDETYGRYRYLPCPTKVPPYVIGPTNARIAIISESEFGAMLWYQEVPAVLCVGLGGATKPIDEYTHNLLRKIDLIFIAMDSDPAGTDAAAYLAEKYPQAIRFRCGVAKTWEDRHIDGSSALKKLVEPYETAFEEGMLDIEEETLDEEEEKELATVLGRETRKHFSEEEIKYLYEKVKAGQEAWRNDVEPDPD